VLCFRRRPFRWLVLLAVVLAPPLASPAGSVPLLAELQDGASVVSVPVRVSGPSPFWDGCEGSALRSRVYRGSAVEPMLAVDPRDPRHLVAAWQQDRIATAAASGVLAAVSRDGGRTWTTSSPTFTRCTAGTPANGGARVVAADPWVTIAPNGDVYVVVLALNAFAGPETVSAIAVSKSADGGATWSDPVALTRDPIAAGFNDKPTITADPFDASYVYAVWDRDFLASQTASGLVEAPLHFARTTDGGLTWESPRIIYSAPGARTIGPTIVVLPNGALVNVFGRALPSAAGELSYDLALIRSTDRGATWSEPLSASDMVLAPLQDPFSTFRLQPDPSLAFIPTVAVDRQSGRLHVAWQDGRFSEGDHTDIAYTTSADGGRT
jgi:Neuraminidase (sialidase)